MSYTPSWSNGASGRVAGGVHDVRLADAVELADAVNRRRRLTYQAEHDFSAHVGEGKFVRLATVKSSVAADNFRDSLASCILSPPTGSLGGEPSTPGLMTWLWPENDADENKRIVAGTPGAGEVSLFAGFNATAGWTDASPSAGGTVVRAVHFNELRQAAERLRRGRWMMPLYTVSCITSILPDTPWISSVIGNNGEDQTHCLGFSRIRDTVSVEEASLGVTNATVRPGSRIELYVSADCTVDVYRVRQFMDFGNDPPSWNQARPVAGVGWSSPGALGDCTLMGSISLSANAWGSLGGSGVAGALQAMVDGEEQSFLFARADTDDDAVYLQARLVIEFDLNAPPS